MRSIFRTRSLVLLEFLVFFCQFFFSLMGTAFWAISGLSAALDLSLLLTRNFLLGCYSFGNGGDLI